MDRGRFPCVVEGLYGAGEMNPETAVGAVVESVGARGGQGFSDSGDRVISGRSGREITISGIREPEVVSSWTP